MDWLGINVGLNTTGGGGGRGGLAMNQDFYFILLASPKTNKQTYRKNIGMDMATAVANYSGPGY